MSKDVAEASDLESTFQEGALYMQGSWNYMKRDKEAGECMKHVGNIKQDKNARNTSGKLCR